MYIEKEHFDNWMKKLHGSISELCHMVRAHLKKEQLFAEGDTLLDNQDLVLLLKTSHRSLQRYRSNGELPYIGAGNKKVLYRASEVRAFVEKHRDVRTLKVFDHKYGTNPKDENGNLLHTYNHQTANGNSSN